MISVVKFRTQNDLRNYIYTLCYVGGGLIARSADYNRISIIDIVSKCKPSSCACTRVIFNFKSPSLYKNLDLHDDGSVSFLLEVCIDGHFYYLRFDDYSKMEVK